MLDLSGIVFSSIMMLIVIVRAVRLDLIQPWFQAVKRQQAAAPEKPPSWRPKD